MTPTEAVQQLVHVLSNIEPPFSEDDIRAALERAGVPDDVADRAFRFGQIACGRRFLDGMGISFSNEYICFNSNGDVVESGDINGEPFFVAATQLAGPENVGGPAFGHFALMSSDVAAVNDALNSGSDPADLVGAPAALFLEPPTDSGLAHAQDELSRHFVGLAAQGAPPKPWWKFW